MCSCLRQYWIVNTNLFIPHLLGCKQFYSKVQGFFADQLEVALPLHLCLGPFTPTCYKRWRCWTWTRAPTWSIFHIFSLCLLYGCCSQLTTHVNQNVWFKERYLSFGKQTIYYVVHVLNCFRNNKGLEVSKISMECSYRISLNGN